MLSKKETTRYSRQIQLEDFGIKGQERMKTANVVVIGAGGLGCSVIQYLSAAGIGEITIIDGDSVSETNLQRQLLYTYVDIGKNKAQLSAKRASEINPFIRVKSECSFLNVELAFNAFADADLIVDCSDNFGTRYLINDVCVLLNKPFVSAALYKYEGQVSTYNVKTPNGYSANYRNVFPETGENKTGFDCNMAGVIGTLPGLMGLYQANEVIKYFLDKEFCLVNKLLVLDCKKMTHKIFELGIESAPHILSKEEIENRAYILPCISEEDKDEIGLLDVISSLKNEEVMLIDVREFNELPKLENIKHLSVPLSELAMRMEVLASYKRVIFICKSGSRSAQAKAIIKNVYSSMQCNVCNFSIEQLMEVIRETTA